MRTLLSIAIGCALVLGINLAASAGATRLGVQPATELLSPAAGDALDETQLENESAYECRYSPYCQRDSQCTTYCAGGIPVCFQGCCSCAS
jgi:hypothetical protein